MVYRHQQVEPFIGQPAVDLVLFQTYPVRVAPRLPFLQRYCRSTLLALQQQAVGQVHVWTPLQIF